MSRQFAIAVALLAAVGVLVAAMAWSTAARGQAPDQAENVLRVERGITDLLPAARGRLIEQGGNEGYATFFSFGHSLRG